jgi:hypothetical protein
MGLNDKIKKEIDSMAKMKELFYEMKDKLPADDINGLLQQCTLSEIAQVRNDIDEKIYRMKYHSERVELQEMEELRAALVKVLTDFGT